METRILFRCSPNPKDLLTSSEVELMEPKRKKASPRRGFLYVQKYPDRSDRPYIHLHIQLPKSDRPNYPGTTNYRLHPMTTPLICHLLIGIPGSGTSALARQWGDRDPSCQVVSADRIRAELYDDADKSENWSDTEPQVLSRIRQHLAQGTSIIYDAPNIWRAQRLSLLQQLQQGGDRLDDGTDATPPVLWMAWHLQTPLAICKERNRRSGRATPLAEMEQMARALKVFPPHVAEGFAAVNPVPLCEDGSFDLPKIQRLTQNLPKSMANQMNRTKETACHAYSRLLDFERLMHLISLLLRYPGLGHLDREQRLALFQTDRSFDMALAEIAAAIAQEYGTVYADAEALAGDLSWLECNGMLGSQSASGSDIDVEPMERPPNTACHRYSDRTIFLRLMQTIRFFTRSPLLQQPGEKIQDTLIRELQRQGGGYQSRDSLRKDIELALRPYRILSASSHRRGYFIGTSILTARELNRIYRLLQEVKQLDNPMDVATRDTLRERLQQAQLLEVDEAYPIRVVGKPSIVSIQDLHSTALARDLARVEQAIERGELVELRRFTGSGRYKTDPEQGFRAWCLQLVFHNIAWYLGFEVCGGERDKLLRFERLDRLYWGTPIDESRDRQAQHRALTRLTKLYDASAGLFLGDCVEDQRLYLSSKKEERRQVEVTVELWCNDTSFRFISEGTRRFAPKSMQMSPRPGGKRYTSEKLFDLKPTPDPLFPHRFQVKLPHWSLWDIDLVRWILGFGGQVKVIHPEVLRQQVGAIGKEIAELYNGGEKLAEG